MKSRLWIIITFLAYVFLLIPTIQAEVKEMDENLPQPDDPVLFSVTDKDITLDIVSFKLVTIPVSKHWSDKGTKDYFMVDYCFTAPDDGEWVFIPDKFNVGNDELWNPGGRPGGYVSATDEKQGKICSRLEFDITDLNLDWDLPLIIRFQCLMAIPREGSSCKDLLRRFETNTKAQFLKVKLSCTDDIENDWIRGPKDYILTVTDWDREKMTQEEAQTKIEELLNFNIEGNWTIVIDNALEYIE